MNNVLFNFFTAWLPRKVNPMFIGFADKSDRLGDDNASARVSCVESGGRAATVEVSSRIGVPSRNGRIGKVS